MPGPKYPNAQSEAEWFDLILKGLAAQWVASAAVGNSAWWYAAAGQCIRAGNAQLITSRDSTVVYMLRCWLSPPKPCTNGQHAKYESGNAVLLHWILQPDDIPHLHNHPWDFTTRILAGGYTEQRAWPGPMTRTDELFLETFTRNPGDVIGAPVTDWHRIASHLSGPGDPSTGHGGTWSLVTTGPRVQPWSFLINGHAHDAEAFLRAKRDQEANAVTHGPDWADE